MSDQENIKAASALFEAWNAGDLSRLEPYQGDDYTLEQPGAPGPMNKEQAMAYLHNFLTAFPGSQFEVLLTITQGDYVVQHWRATGTNGGPLRSPSGAIIPPSGKNVVVTGSSTSVVKNGKVVRSWNFWDLASLLGQMGVIPPM
jgi:ketosteroid isomerase-like protein